MNQSYDYARRDGVHEISWSEFGEYAARLTASLAEYNPQVIVGIARAGLFPATAAACMLRREMYPVRITRRVNDEVVYPEPVWKVPVTPDVEGKVVAVVDEIADSGQTLAMAVQAVRAQGARHVVTACLVCHTWARPVPDVSVLVSEALVIFPWDRQVWMGGDWRPHPEIVSALAAQGHNSDR